MSYDRKIDQVCQHLVVEEALFLETDRVTVRPLRPIASAATVKVRFNGLTEVPSPGLILPAVVKGSKQGPFKILPGVNDLLKLQADDGTSLTLKAAPGLLTADQLALSLNQNAGMKLRFLVNNNRIQIVSTREGSKATIFVASGSTIAATIGLSESRMWRGNTAVPGWFLVRDPNTLDDRPTRLIVFDSPLKGFSDFVELSYAVIREECRRCGGLGIENDWRYGKDGSVITVEDEALLIQEFQKMVYTVRGTNRFHLWYGTDILTTIGKKLGSTGIIQNLIVADIYDAFRRWQSIKKQQEEEVGQFVSDREYPFRMTSVVLEQSNQDPTVLFVTASLQNRSSQPIQIERGVKIPQPTDLLGATAQEGVYRASLQNYVQAG